MMSMEIDTSNSNPSDSDNPRFSINVLQLLKSAQMGDYTRYRKYCTARLRRLYKSLKFTHCRGKYARKAITQSTVTEVSACGSLYGGESLESRHEEKAITRWSKCKSTDLYLIGRLRKAVKWATLFAQLCASKGDSRTSLEAEAYASYMTGNLFEQDQNWDNSLVNFKRARTLLFNFIEFRSLENRMKKDKKGFISRLWR